MHKFQKVTKFDETINADESTDMLAYAEAITDSPNLHRNTASVVKDDGENYNESVTPIIVEYPDLPDKGEGAVTVNLSLQEDPAFEVEDDSRDENDSLMIEENPDLPNKEVGLGKTDKAVPSKGNIDLVKTPLSDFPNQPIRKQYAPRSYGKTFRDFQAKWFKEHPWLSFEQDENHAICWACQKFMNE
jgi:hypothetical protein